jgi:hypothetical protein
MTMTLRIAAGPVSAEATLNDTSTAQALWDALPIEAAAQTWGDEIYFPIPVSLAEEDAQAVVAPGDLGYWPPGRAFCIFFGPTPASRGDECRPASPVNVLGRVNGDPRVWKKVRAGARMRLERGATGDAPAERARPQSGAARPAGR